MNAGVFLAAFSPRAARLEWKGMRRKIREARPSDARSGSPSASRPEFAGILSLLASSIVPAGGEEVPPYRSVFQGPGSDSAVSNILFRAQVSHCRRSA